MVLDGATETPTEVMSALGGAALAAGWALSIGAAAFLVARHLMARRDLRGARRASFSAGAALFAGGIASLAVHQQPLLARAIGLSLVAALGGVSAGYAAAPARGGRGKGEEAAATNGIATTTSLFRSLGVKAASVRRTMAPRAMVVAVAAVAFGIGVGTALPPAVGEGRATAQVAIAWIVAAALALLTAARGGPGESPLRRRHAGIFLLELGALAALIVATTGR